jgi:TonB family protein
MGTAMSRYLSAFCLFALILCLPQLPDNPRAKNSVTGDGSKIDPGVMTLAGKLAEELREGGLKRVVILDLRGPSQGGYATGNPGNPVGKWLADQLSAALRGSTPEFPSVERTTDESDGKVRAAGADAVVSGSFDRVAQRLEISLTAKPTKPSADLIGPILQEIAISPEITALSSREIPEKMFRAGVGGVSAPVCIYCPMPPYSDEARKKDLNGSVGVDVTVTTQGAVEDIVVTRALGLGLDEKAIEAMKGWKLKSCSKDGQAVACRVVIEVAFRTFRNH